MLYSPFKPGQTRISWIFQADPTFATAVMSAAELDPIMLVAVFGLCIFTYHLSGDGSFEKKSFFTLPEFGFYFSNSFSSL
jgi:hypothetical protein